MQAVVQLLGKILMGLVTEKVIKTLVAVALEYLVKSSKNELDDKLAQPIIDELRK